MPDWQVLHLGTSVTGALVTVKITAATASMTMAMAKGIERTTGFSTPGTVRSAGKMPDSTTNATPARKMSALAIAPLLSGALASGPAFRCNSTSPDASRF
jgi:hypothetical protein